MEINFQDLFDTANLNPSNYQYFHQLFDKRTIVFNKEIEEDVVESVYLPLKDFEEDDISTPVTLIINSLGGSVSDGFFLADYIAQYKKKLNIIVLGYAASMAAIVLAGGGKNPNVVRKCYPSSYALIHDGYVAIQASEAKTADDIMDFNKRVDGRIKEFFITNTNITEEVYNEHSRRQWFLNAQELKTMGLVDEIIGVDNNDN